jgi:capsular polysaccharide biosynthesis protein
MPKAAQGSAKSPAAGGSARTKQSRREARSSKSGGPAVPEEKENAQTTEATQGDDRAEPPPATDGTAASGSKAAPAPAHAEEKAPEKAAPAPKTGPGGTGADAHATGEDAEAEAGSPASKGTPPSPAPTTDPGDHGTRIGTSTKTAAFTRTAPLPANSLTGNGSRGQTPTRTGTTASTTASTTTRTPARTSARPGTGTTASTSTRKSADSNVSNGTGTGTRTGTGTSTGTGTGAKPRTRPAYRSRVPEPAPPAPRLSDRLRAGLRRMPWWPLPLCLVLGAAGGEVYSAVTPAQYSAVSYVVVSPSGGSEAAGALGYAQAYGKIATDPVILADAEKRAHLRPGTIRDGIQASTSPDAPMVQITATSSSASQAARNADSVAKALTHTAKTSVKRTGARLTVLSEAMAPATPVSPSGAVAVGVGACAGGLLGGLVLLARPRSRRRQDPATAPASGGMRQTAAPGTDTAADGVSPAAGEPVGAGYGTEQAR